MMEEEELDKVGNYILTEMLLDEEAKRIQAKRVWEAMLAIQTMVFPENDPEADDASPTHFAAHHCLKLALDLNAEFEQWLKAQPK